MDDDLVLTGSWKGRQCRLQLTRGSLSLVDSTTGSSALAQPLRSIASLQVDGRLLQWGGLAAIELDEGQDEGIALLAAHFDVAHRAEETRRGALPRFTRPVPIGPAQRAFRAATSALLIAPVVILVFVFSALGAGFSQDSSSSDEGPSVRSIITVMWVCLGVLATVVILAIVVLVRDLVGSRDAADGRTVARQVRDGPVNKKAVVSVVFAIIAVAASASSTSRGQWGYVWWVFPLALPAALYALVFGLRAMGEIRDARGHQTGGRAAAVGLSVGALVALASSLALIL